MKPSRRLLVFSAASTLILATPWQTVAEACTTAATITPPAADRAAILAMAGEYRVTFRFDETVALRSGYEPTPRKVSAGTELVVVVEDSPTRVVLQHLLLDPKHNHVVKHWRQDWIWQAPTILEFRGDRHWVRRQLSEEESTGRWVQSVFEVDDSPRYASLGRWEHRGKVSEWRSESTWRPLPRREITTRDDYDVLVGVNRHMVMPWGWLHAQDNAKLDLRRNSDEPWLVRETGINTYRRITDVDFAAARNYWQRTADYWNAVRDAWARQLDSASAVWVDLELDGSPLMDSLLGLAEDDLRPLAERIRLANSLIEEAAREAAAFAQR